MTRCDFILSRLVMMSFGRDCLLSRFPCMARCDFPLSVLAMISFGRDCLLSRVLGMARCDFLLSFLVMISFGRDCLLSRYRGIIHVAVSRTTLGKLSLPNTTGSPFGGVVGSRTILRNLVYRTL